MIPTWFRPYFLLLAAGLPLACGQRTGNGPEKKPPAAAQAAAPIDACALMDPDDVRQLTGDVSGSLSSTLDDAVGKDPSQCVYTLGSDLPPKVISLQVRVADSAERAAALHRAAESGLSSFAGGVQPAPGLGDAAFWVGGKLDQLHVLAGNRQLIFTVQIDQHPLGAARTLATKALARLKAGPAAQSPLRPRPGP